MGRDSFGNLLLRMIKFIMCDANEELKEWFFDATEVDQGRPLDVGRQRLASTRQCGWGSKDLGREELLKNQH
jgi:hypothetical protein